MTRREDGVHAVLVERRPLRVDRARHEAADDARAVERRDRQQVEDAEADVDDDRPVDDLERVAGELRVRPDGGRRRRQHEVRGRPGGADERHADLRRGAQVVRIDHHGLGPAEQERRPAEVGDHEHERAERIQVRERVERQPSHLLGAAVAERVRGQRMRKLVERERDDEDRRDQQEAVKARVAHVSARRRRGHPDTRSMRAPSARSRSSMRS